MKLTRAQIFERLMGAFEGYECNPLDAMDAIADLQKSFIHVMQKSGFEDETLRRGVEMQAQGLLQFIDANRAVGIVQEQGRLQ